jgi:hypothetical protein
LLLNVVASETIEITPEQALGMILGQTVAEGIAINAGYIEPNGSFTTWTMNTRTGAVAEYSNYEFNSFARVGNKYVGATSQGLFELLGDTDDGTNIIAELKGGYFQFGGTHLSRLKGAFIAAAGEEGNYVLRIETKDGEVYDYRISARNGRSSQFHMGKGQRSRYFAYTLTSAGQDFTLDTLEFVPVVLQRRV